MTFTIIRNPDPEKLIRMGQGAKLIERPIEDLTNSVGVLQRNLESATIEPPVVEPKNKRGRKKMTDEKLRDETGVETIRKEDAGTPGAVGSGGENAPAQEKVPETPQGDKEGG